MTDDEIDAVLIPKLARHIGMAEVDVRILPFDRIAYRAGMREAAKIVSGCWCGNAAAIEIERAASEKDNS